MHILMPTITKPKKKITLESERRKVFPTSTYLLLLTHYYSRFYMANCIIQSSAKIVVFFSTHTWCTGNKHNRKYMNNKVGQPVVTFRSRKKEKDKEKHKFFLFKVIINVQT